MGWLYFFTVILIQFTHASPSLVRSNDKPSHVGSIQPRGTPTGPGPHCTAVTTYIGTTANVTILGPKGNVLGRNDSIEVPGKGWYNLDSQLPFTLAMKRQKHDALLLQYSNDEPWTVLPQSPSRNIFDCRQFKFNLITNFWTFEDKKSYDQGTLNWTMRALDETELGGSPQTDLMAQYDGNYEPAATLTSMLDEVVDVYWTTKNAMTFKYASQSVSISNATGAHVSILIGSAPMNVFNWATSGIL